MFAAIPSPCVFWSPPNMSPQKHRQRRGMKTVNLTTVDALGDLPAIEALAVELATFAGCEIVAVFRTIFTVRHKPARDAVSPTGQTISEHGSSWPHV